MVSKPFVFKIHYNDGKELFFQASGEEQMMKWIATLVQVVTLLYIEEKEMKANAIVFNLDVFEGEVEVPSMLWGWSKRWLCLKGGVMYIFNSKGGSRESKTALYHCGIEFYKNSTDCMQIVTENGEKTIVIKYKSNDELMTWRYKFMSQKDYIEGIIDDIDI